MGDINKPNVVSVISEHNGNAICISKAEGKEQVIRTPTNGTTFTAGQQINFYAEIEQNNRILDDVAFRYNFNNTHAASNMYIYNGWWNFIDRMELKVNGGIVLDAPNGSINLMQLGKFNNYETFSRYTANAAGTFIQTAGVDVSEVIPGNFRFAVVNGQSLRFESYLSEIIKCMYKTHVMYIRNFQITIYLKPATNIHKILSFDNGFTMANFSLVNMEMVLYFTKYGTELPIIPQPKISFYEEFYEDRIFDVTALAGQQSTVDIRLDTQYRVFFNIKKAFIWTDNTAVNATHTIATSYPLYQGTDIISVEILHNGIRYLLFDTQRALVCHQNRYHKRRSRRRIHNWLTYTQMNQLPNNFIDFDRNDIVLSNDGHHKVNMLNGISNQVSTNGEWRLRITGNWSADRPNLHLALEVAHIINLFSDPNKTPFFQQ